MEKHTCPYCGIKAMELFDDIPLLPMYFCNECWNTITLDDINAEINKRHWFANLDNIIKGCS